LGVVKFIFVWTGATIVSLLINGFYARFFGFYLDGLLQEGVKFNWILFIIVTLVILAAYRTVLTTQLSKYLSKGVLVKEIKRRFLGINDSKPDLDPANDEYFVLEIQKEL
jgi:hypothetical protein